MASLRWTLTEADLAGRIVKTTRPGHIAASVVLAADTYVAGLLRSTARDGLATTRVEYDALLQPSRTGLDVNASGTLEPASNDRITETVRGYLQSGADWYRYTRVQAYDGNGNGTPSTVSMKRIISRSFTRTPLAD